jgi:FKBP-type peptidyl-prolyl cis-trans isomerase FkpA
MRNLFILLVGVALMAGCNAHYEKTKSGLRYKIIKGKGGNKINNGDFIKFNQVVAIPEKDTILNTTYGKVPGYIKIDTGARTEYSFVEVIRKMSVGDSAVIIFSVDSLVKRHMIPEYDKTFHRGGQVTLRLRVLKSYTNEQEVNNDYQKDQQAQILREQKEAEGKNKEEAKSLEEYIKKNNIKATKTASGAYVEILQPGSGPKADSGTIATVYYTGKLLKTGTAFDSNRDPKFSHTDPFDVSIGTSATVRGFDEGLRYFAKGGKGRIFMPSEVAYGGRGIQDVIPPFSTLVFEVEVINVKPAPPQPQQPVPSQR